MIPRRAVVSWILYDLANTIFSMGVVSMYFSTWVRDQVGAAHADAVYGVITAISMGVIFIISPLLGAMSDRARRRMPFLVVSTVICVALTMVLARIGYTGTMVAFVVANAAYQAGLQFYDSLLPDVTTEENRGRISGIGVGIGYLGSYVAVGIGILLGTTDKALLFSLIGIAFLAFSIPCFLFVREQGNPNPKPFFDLPALVDSTKATVTALRSSDRFPGLGRFLFGRIFYTDAINTVISIMTLYTVNVAVSTGMTSEQGEAKASLVMLSAISFAVAGGFFWGWLVDRIGPKRTLDAVLQLWVVTFILAAVIGLFHLPIEALFLAAAMAGVALGGIWSADRPLMLRLTPPDRVGEFYGLYGMVGRFSAITGPLIWAGVTSLTIHSFEMSPERGQGIGVLTLLVMVLFSMWVLRRVDDAPRDWAALSGGRASS
ncbi:MAG: MFS transporter [Gemmatimonadaceae bacterium]|nr:MFS transporter [Gemmatimonadaceae bacterium]